MEDLPSPWEKYRRTLSREAQANQSHFEGLFLRTSFYYRSMVSAQLLDQL